QEEHDDDLRDDPEGVAEQTGYLAAQILADGLGRAVEIDGVGDGLDARGDGGMVADEFAEFLLVTVVAHSVDGGDGLLADVLHEEEAGDDDGEDDEDEANR